MSVAVALLRHGRTAWNEAGRIQGRTDVGLSASGRAALERRAVPREYAGFDWYATPLRRTVETAAALGIALRGTARHLVEHDWGEWEGSTRAELEARLGDAYREMGRRGMDFRPPGGESTRDVRARLLEWLALTGARGRPVAAITHKGVIQVALAVATGWDLVSERPCRLEWDRLHVFAYDAPSARLRIARVNVPLAPR